MEASCALAQTLVSAPSLPSAWAHLRTRHAAFALALHEMLQVARPALAESLARAERERNSHAAGLEAFLRQVRAIDARPCQHETLRRLGARGVPVLVIHGRDDALAPVHPSGSCVECVEAERNAVDAARQLAWHSGGTISDDNAEPWHVF